MEEFDTRAERIRNGMADPGKDNFLKITHEARLLGTDARLLERDAPDDSESKLHKVQRTLQLNFLRETGTAGAFARGMKIRKLLSAVM